MKLPYLAKLAMKMVVGAGVNEVLSNAIKFVTPADISKPRQVMVKIGILAITNVVCGAIADRTVEEIDEAIQEITAPLTSPSKEAWDGLKAKSDFEKYATDDVVMTEKMSHVLSEPDKISVVVNHREVEVPVLMIPMGMTTKEAIDIIQQTHQDSMMDTRDFVAPGISMAEIAERIESFKKEMNKEAKDGGIIS